MRPTDLVDLPFLCCLGKVLCVSFANVVLLGASRCCVSVGVGVDWDISLRL